MSHTCDWTFSSFFLSIHLRAWTQSHQTTSDSWERFWMANQSLFCASKLAPVIHWRLIPFLWNQNKGGREWKLDLPMESILIWRIRHFLHRQTPAGLREKERLCGERDGNRTDRRWWGRRGRKIIDEKQTKTLIGLPIQVIISQYRLLPKLLTKSNDARLFSSEMIFSTMKGRQVFNWSVMGGLERRESKREGKEFGYR